jgi:hypothetical protein
MTHNPIHIFYSPDDEGYIAEFEGLSDYIGFGLSPIMALYELLEAKEKLNKKNKNQSIAVPPKDQLPVEKNVFRETGIAIWNN